MGLAGAKKTTMFGICHLKWDVDANMTMRYKLDYITFFCSNAMHGKFGLNSPGKANSHSTALPNFFSPPCVQCFRAFYTTDCEAYSFMTDGYEIFYVNGTNLRACRTHEGGGGGGGGGGSGTNKTAQELTEYRTHNLYCL